MRSSSPRPNDHIRHRAIKRDLAIERVSRLTTGTAIAGAVATIGFAGLAAFTFTGKSTAADDQQATTDEQATTTDDSGSQDTQALTPTSTGSTSATSQGARSTLAPTYYQTQPVTPPTVHGTRSHVSSGGS